MTKIEWTDATWNPTTGCTHASPGCANCYAEKLSHRLAAMGQAKYDGVTVATAEGPKFHGTLRTHEDALTLPLRLKRPRRVFVNSMSDLFHKNVPVEFIARVFAIMAMCPQHQFQVLSKRPQRMLRLVSDKSFLLAVVVEAGKRQMRSGLKDSVCIEIVRALPNVLLGCSPVNQETADAYLPSMRAIAASGWQTFVSYEPALGPIADWDTWASFLTWGVAGGESGPGARPAHSDWFRSMRDAFERAGKPWLFKQWGEWCDMQRVGKKAAGRMFDGQIYDGLVPLPGGQLKESLL